MINKEFARTLNDRLREHNPEEILQYFLREFPGKVALSSSLGAEDQVLTHMMAGIDTNAFIFTLDTGRQFAESYDLIHRTQERYGIRIKVFFPDHAEVESMVNEHGINLFYQSIENRKLCCHIRKIVPLRRALGGLDAWICGLRKEQSPTRDSVEPVVWDETNGLIKISPLAEWNNEQVWQFIQSNNVPYNPLHDQGFVSIGCQPCTRAILANEDQRAGRWWWEQPETKECGLHKRD
ncbi:MAG TPA: phosphoadenylyl-sulfate reductase [Bacteroidales bacterium]|nr:phosphoadenylyl-sulfate reductase [Bacteroidales bacterium]